MVAVAHKSNKQEIAARPENSADQSFELLGLPPLDQAEQEQISARATQLEQTLTAFKLKARVRLVQLGPSVTTYGLSLQPGVKVSLVRGLEADLALALGLRSVRLEIPLPGTNLIGVEVPNSRRRWVELDEVVSSPQFNHFAGALKLPVGRDNAGRIVVADLARLPHLVVAGVTGGGKSAFLNSVLTAWTTGLYQPDELSLILIDPKQVELAKFAQVPHLYLPVITALTQAQALAASNTTGNPLNQGRGQAEDRDQAGLLNAITVLGWLVAEMKTRYRRFRAAGVSNLAAYNRLVERLNHQQHSQEQANQPDQQPNQELEKLPRLVVVVDEIASLMAVINREAEAKVGEYYLKELLNMGRAAGLHLILATQYPSTAVLPGEIKSQIPGRICFAVSREVDSRVVLDQSGAEGLLGRGDMLARLGEATVSAFTETEQGPSSSVAGAAEQSSGGGDELSRAQSVFIEDEEIARRLAALYGSNKGNAATNQAEELAATIARLAALPMPSLSDLALELAATVTSPTVSSDQAAQGEIDDEGSTNEEPGENTTTKRRKGGRRAGNGSSSSKAQLVTIPQPQVLVLPPAPAPTLPTTTPPTASTTISGAAGKNGSEQTKDQERERDQAAERVSELEQALAQARSRTGELEEKLAQARREVDSLRQQIETVSRLKVTLDSGVVLPLPAALAQAELDTLKVGQLVVAESPNSPSQPNPTPALPTSRAQAPAAAATITNSLAPTPVQRRGQPVAASSSPSPSPYQVQTERAYQTMMVDAERRNNKRIEALVNDLMSDLNRLSRSDRAVLRYLSRHQTEEFTTEQLAKKLGYKPTSLANHPPVALVELGLVRRWQDYRKEGRRYRNVYVYRAAVEEYLKKHKELEGVTPEQILARLKV